MLLQYIISPIIYCAHSGQRHCQLVPDSHVFADPCVDTFKYLRVKYSCVPRPLRSYYRYYQHVPWHITLFVMLRYLYIGCMMHDGRLKYTDMKAAYKARSNVILQICRLLKMLKTRFLTLDQKFDLYDSTSRWNLMRPTGTGSDHLSSLAGVCVKTSPAR